MNFTPEEITKLSENYKEAWFFLNILRLERENKAKDDIIKNLQKEKTE